MSSSENEDIEMNQESSEEEESTVGQEENAESGAEEPDVNASATESDEDDEDSDEVDDDKDVPAEKAPKIPKTPRVNVEKISKELKAKNAKRIGKQLYIRFPHKLPEKTDECYQMVQSLSNLIVSVHKPRQKHARFCLVDFKSTEDRDKALEELSKNDKKIVVSLPRVDDEDFLQKIIEKKIKSKQAKLAKNLLRKESKKLVTQREFTSTLVILNVPKGTTISQIKELFPDAVDIQTKPAAKKFAGQMVANVTLPTTADARKNFRRKLELGGKKLLFRYQKTTKKSSVGKPQKGPLAPPSEDKPKEKPLATESAEEKPTNGDKAAAKSPKKAKKSKKQSVPENGSTEVTKQKVKKPFPPHKAKPEVKKPLPPNKGKPGQNKQPAAKQKKVKAAK